MRDFFNSVIKRILINQRWDVVVEIGSEYGDVTGWIMDFCATLPETDKFVLHSIDPDPKYDVEQYHQAFPNRFFAHLKTSLEWLSVIQEYEIDWSPKCQMLVLLDGDHNYYTVSRELRYFLSSGATVLVHDTGWPYARRDMYYSPERIPEGECHPWELSDLGNGPQFNAKHEGGPKNGVLTAVEDVMGETNTHGVIHIPGFHGLSILLPPDNRFDSRYYQFSITKAIVDHIELLERRRTGRN
jgi:hypothetical protein